MIGKIIFILILIILLAGCNNQVVSVTQADYDSLRKIKEVYWPKSYKEQDTILLNKILDETFRLVDQDGSWSDKKLELEYIKTNKPSYDSFRFNIKRLDVYPNGTAVVAGTGIIKTKEDTLWKVTEYQSSNVFVKKNTEWKAILSHVSGVKDRSDSSIQQ